MKLLLSALLLFVTGSYLEFSESCIDRRIRKERANWLDRNRHAGLMSHPLSARIRRIGGKSRTGIALAGRVPCLQSDGG